MITTTQYTIRHPYPYDSLTGIAWEGMEHLANPDWVWVQVDDYGRVVAGLAVAPAHGLVIVLRLWATPDASYMAIRKLLRAAATELRERDIRGWMVMLEASRISELKLSRLALRFGGKAQGFVGFIYAGGMGKLCQQR